MRLIIIYTLLSISVVQLSGMDIVTYPKEHIIWNALISESLRSGDYKLYRNIAVLNRGYNKFIEEEYRPKKKLLDKFREENKKNLSPVTGYVSWNKDFSKCAWVTISAEQESCTLTLLSLDDKNCIVKKDAVWDEYHFPIFEDDIHPFFNKKEQVGFYGYGYKGIDYPANRFPDPIYLAHGCEAVLEYLLDFSGNAGSKRCFFTITNRPKMYNFINIFDFPLILKALLQSTRTYDECKWCSDVLKIFVTDGMTIPANYKFFKKHIGWKNRVDIQKVFSWDPLPNSFEDLSSEVKKNLEELYQKQLEKK